VQAPTIAIVTYDSLGDLERFFDGQLAVAEELGTGLVAVDNHSGDGTRELLRAREASHHALNVVEMGRNAGYAAAVNAAFAAAPGRDLLLLNPDVELTGAAPVIELVGFAERHPRLGVIAPRLLSDDGSVQASARRYPSLLAALGTVEALARLAPVARSRRRYEEPSDSEVPVEVDWVIGAAMLIRRAAHEQVGGWDEGYRLYLEDTDFCRRCWSAGWGVAYVPSVRLNHVYPRASSRPGASVVRSRLRRRHLAGFARFFAKNPSRALGFGRGTGAALDR
jgi:N-acetylglucosaminyl-diphospho-decaprenol L-rhamnosyltransferase